MKFLDKKRNLKFDVEYYIYRRIMFRLVVIEVTAAKAQALTAKILCGLANGRYHMMEVCYDNT